ncbi:hypothetical protein PITCH_A760045 [uncultured Desulfobacterium sp.]|uniref:Response regulatory domain-containing protein n=1 Tax=uncultured Desulfobacterium sp. TaxID=201089 RepID=A0A445N2B1_9BACT|nr:hypothetical protein PITCH_A760045 [uncultured Desulfobacterium sp.]
MSSPVVLLVDDEVPFVRALTKRLSKRGFTVKAAFNGEEALGVLAKKPTSQNACCYFGCEAARRGLHRHIKTDQKGGKK